MIREELLHIRIEEQPNYNKCLPEDLRDRIIKYLKKVVEIAKNNTEFVEFRAMKWNTLIKFTYSKIKNMKQFNGKYLLDINTWYDLDNILCWYPEAWLRYHQKEE